MTNSELNITSNKIKFSKEEQELFDLVSTIADELNYPTFVVGGFVRDKILGRDYKQDIDFVCVGSGIKLAKYLANKLPGQPLVSEFKNFGTAHFNYGNLDLEFVGARKESYDRGSRKPVVEDGTLEDDQTRRDFTINALAIVLNRKQFGKLIDPFNGLIDIEDKILRTPTDPDITFSDDPLRMMRAIRFATQLNFSIEPKTFESIGKNKDRIKIISQERITDELNKIILSEKPSVGFNLLSDSGLLEIIFPELYNMHGTEIIDGKGHKNNFYHTLEVLDNLSENSNDLWLRWAAILHDIAKPATKRFDKNIGWTFHGHEVVGARMTKQIFNKMKLPLQNEKRFLEKMVLLHLRPISLTKENVTDSAIRRLIFDAGDDMPSLLLLCNADITTKNRLKVRRYRENFEMVKQKVIDLEERDHIRNFQPPVSGEIIMKTFNLSPGKEVGIIKSHIRESILDGVIPNQFDAAYQLMLEKGKDIGLVPEI